MTRVNNSTVNLSNIFYPPFLLYSLLSCCYTHHPPLSLSLSLTFFFVNVIVSYSCSFVVFLFYCSLLVYCILLLYNSRGYISDRADGRKKNVRTNDAHFWPLFRPLSKGLSGNHAQLVLKLVPGTWYLVLNQNFFLFPIVYFCP